MGSICVSLSYRFVVKATYDYSRSPLSRASRPFTGSLLNDAGRTMPIDSARCTSAFASYRPKAAGPLPAKSGRLGAVGGRSAWVDSGHLLRSNRGPERASCTTKVAPFVACGASQTMSASKSRSHMAFAESQKAAGSDLAVAVKGRRKTRAHASLVSNFTETAARNEICDALTTGSPALKCRSAGAKSELRTLSMQNHFGLAMGDPIRNRYER